MSGLGGGSSDAVSALLAMNELGDENFPEKKLLKWRLKLVRIVQAF